MAAQTLHQRPEAQANLSAVPAERSAGRVDVLWVARRRPNFKLAGPASPTRPRLRWTFSLVRTRPIEGACALRRRSTETGAASHTPGLRPSAGRVGRARSRAWRSRAPPPRPRLPNDTEDNGASESAERPMQTTGPHPRIPQRGQRGTRPPPPESPRTRRVRDSSPRTRHRRRPTPSRSPSTAPTGARASTERDLGDSRGSPLDRHLAPSKTVIHAVGIPYERRFLGD